VGAAPVRQIILERCVRTGVDSGPCNRVPMLCDAGWRAGVAPLRRV